MSASLLWKIQTWPVNNLRILRIKDAKFSGYYSYMNPKMKFSNLHKCTFKLILKCFILWETDHVAEDFSFEKSIEVHFNRSKIILLYFYDVYDINLWKTNFGRSTVYSCRTNFFFIISSFYEKKNRHSWRLNNSSKKFLNQLESMVFCKLILNYFILNASALFINRWYFS